MIDGAVLLLADRAVGANHTQEGWRCRSCRRSSSLHIDCWARRYSAKNCVRASRNLAAVRVDRLTGHAGSIE